MVFLKGKTSPLPVKDGVSPNCLYLPKGDWGTVFDYFLERFPHLSHDQVNHRFKNNEVVSACGEVLAKNSKYKAEQHIYFYRELNQEASLPFEEKIVYQDENILVADKPHFLPVAPTGNYLHHTLLVRLRRRLKNDSLELCHRLDRETAGLVLLTKKPELRAQYHKLFSERQIKKNYHALVKLNEINFPVIRESRLVKGEPFFRMKEVLGEPNSKTIIELIEHRVGSSLLKLTPITGKKHQLRVHLAALNIPIVNDVFYPDLQQQVTEDYSSPLQLLAKSLDFIDPISSKSQHFESTFCL